MDNYTEEMKKKEGDAYNKVRRAFYHEMYDLTGLKMYGRLIN